MAHDVVAVAAARDELVAQHTAVDVPEESALVPYMVVGDILHSGRGVVVVGQFVAVAGQRVAHTAVVAALEYGIQVVESNRRKNVGSEEEPEDEGAAVVDDTVALVAHRSEVVIQALSRSPHLALTIFEECSSASNFRKLSSDLAPRYFRSPNLQVREMHW